jgi:hypothetical protein
MNISPKTWNDHMKRLMAAPVVVALFAMTSPAAMVTGNPALDGWVPAGHSLENGTYVRGSGNYGFDLFSLGTTVQEGSSLQINDGQNSWVAGDTVVGVGGAFKAITPEQAGWAAFAGNAVNASLANSTGPKLQVKFGTENAAWSASTIAPGSGNGAGSGSQGGGSVQIRTSGYNSAPDWAVASGVLQKLASSSHIDWTGQSRPDASIARVVWSFDTDVGEVGSWEILLNVSLMDRLYPGQLLPGIGDRAIATVQNGDNAYTDALLQVAVVPEPSTYIAGALLVTFLGATNLGRRLSKRHAA